MRASRMPLYQLAGEVFLLMLTVSMVPAASGEDLHTYYGLLHGHTCFSDGSGTPQEAYAQAKAAGLDFFAVTEHNHREAESGAKERKDGILIATNHALYNGTGPMNVKGQQTLSVIEAAKAASGPDFVALYGQEFSTISSGNHVNVFEIGEVLTVPNGNFRALFEHLNSMSGSDGKPPIVQLNHPGVHNDLFYHGDAKKTLKVMNNDYGIDDGDLGPSFSTLTQACEPFVSLIEMLSGPAMAEQRDPSFHYRPHDEDYFFYLTQGFHVSPTVGQDNHYKTWGTVTDARTGVLCSSLDREALLDGLRHGRTFASEDKNLDLRLMANGEMMGSHLSAAVNDPLRFEVKIKDQDEPNTHYAVTLFHGSIEPTTRSQAIEPKLADNVEGKHTQVGDGTTTFEGVVASGTPEFFYVMVEQTDRDRAWSAPIWINDAIGATDNSMFVWSPESRAKVYHMLDCKNAPRGASRLTGKAPPSDFRPHRCVEEADDGEP